MMLGPPSFQYQAYVLRVKTYTHLQGLLQPTCGTTGISPEGSPCMNGGGKRDAQLSVVLQARQIHQKLALLFSYNCVVSVLRCALRIN